MNHPREELAAAHRPQRLTILTQHFVTPLRPFLVHRMVACNKRLRYLLSWLNLRNTSISIFSCAVYDVLMSVSGCVCAVCCVRGCDYYGGWSLAVCVVLATYILLDIYKHAGKEILDRI